MDSLFPSAPPGASPSAYVNTDGEIELDGGATRVSLVRWEISDPPAPGLPDHQTLERLVILRTVTSIGI